MKSILIKMFLIGMAGLILSSCVTQQAQELPLVGHNYSKSKIMAYNRFGFNDENVPRGILSVISKDPTNFDINVYIADNQGCEFVYTKDEKGTQGKITETGSVKGYLTDKNVLLELNCTGKDSNIDYKIIVYANGDEYDRVGNLSYLAASGEI